MLRLRTTAAIIVLLAAIAGASALWPSAGVEVADFTAFWVAGHRLLAHENPYDATYALEVERSMGFTAERPLVMRNPPWALWVVLPLGALHHPGARLLWTECLVAMLWFSASRVWTIYGGCPRKQWIPLFVTFVFAPALACIAVGQTAPFLLLGLTLFLYLHSGHEFWAGFALLLTAFKPQVAFLFWIALFLWCAENRKWRIMGGLLSSSGLATLIALLFDSHAIEHYRAMLLTESIQTQFIPTLGGFLRLRFGQAWLQLLPAIVGLGWVLTYYFRRRKSWKWKRCLPPLLLGSLLLAPYAWMEDEVVILIALIAAAAGIKGGKYALRIAVGFVGTNIAILILLAFGFRVSSPSYIWTEWVWISFYWLTTKLNPGTRVP